MATPNEQRKKIEALFSKDLFSQWLGIEIVELGSGSATLTLTVRPEMVNGFGIAHGGIAFSLADTTLAFASNSEGDTALSIENSIHYSSAARVGERLTATATRRTESRKLGVYDVQVVGDDGRGVALFRGTVYRPTQRAPEKNEG